MTTAKVEFTTEEKATIKAFSKEERASFDSLPSDIERKEMLILMGGIMGASSDVEVEQVSTQADDNCMILAPSGLGLKAGTVITARLLGTVPMFSTEPKENWDKVEVEGKVVFVNRFYKFESLDGSRTFGIFKSPMLNKVLPKIPTKASNPNVAINPVIRIQYDGKIADKEVLKAEYDFELLTGKEAHAFRIAVEKGVTYDSYYRGAINYLKNPLPNLGEKETIGGMELASRNWNSLQRVGGNAAIAHEGHTNQLSM